MIYQFDSTCEFLQNEFDERVRKNPRYSLRGFAGFLGVNPAELSQVFKGKRHLSLRSAQKITKALGYNNDETRYFLWLLQKEKGKQLGLDLEFIEKRDKKTVSAEQFSRISKWYHFAILSLVETAGFQWDSRHVSKKLGIGLSEAGLAMRDLQEVGLIQVEAQPKGKKLKGTNKTVRVASNIPSEAIRHYHRQMIQKSLEALDTVPLEAREYQSLGIALSPEKLPELKAEIDEFTDRLIGKYHKEGSNQVYQIQISVFPLTKGESK